MTSIQLFFNRPRRPINLEQLYVDMKSARESLILASAWFTDINIAHAFVNSRATLKTAIFNKGDKNRGSKAAYNEILNHLNTAIPGNGWISTELGSPDWRDGVMHHKFIVADNIVYVGSYNYTFNAQNNYETLIRIENEEIAGEFAKEVSQILLEEPLWWDVEQGSSREFFTFSESAFRCCFCRGLFANAERWSSEHLENVCSGCGSKFEPVEEAPW